VDDFVSCRLCVWTLDFERKGGHNHPQANVDQIIFSMYVLYFFIRFCLHFFPSSFSWSVEESSSFWVGIWFGDCCGGEMHSLDHCTYPIWAALSHDLSWSQFKLVWENPNQNMFLNLRSEFYVALVDTSRIIFFPSTQTLCEVWADSAHFSLPGTGAAVSGTTAWLPLSLCHCNFAYRCTYSCVAVWYI
jgi:hypothetical protein